MSHMAELAVLVSLNISSWSARKHDKRVTAEVDQAHGAKDGGRYNKLLIDKTALEPITQIESAARAYNYKVTLGWGNNNERIMSGALMTEHMTTLGQFKDEFESRVNTFVSEYPQHVQAARARLKTMYNPLDYPADIRKAFSFGVDYDSVKTADDFRVKLSEDHIGVIKRDITARMESRQQQAVREVYDRARKIVSKIHEQTSNKDRKLFQSVMDNARSFVDLLPSLNLTGDPALNQIEEELRSLLVPVRALKKNERLRESTAKAADQLLARLPWA